MQWVYNILEEKAEVERVLCKDTNEETGFFLAPDLKWDGNLQTLYMLAIPVPKILSIRELNSSHLPLLKNIQSSCYKAIKEKYNVDAAQLRVYFHYQPSFYHLHIHFSRLGYESAGTNFDFQIYFYALLITTILSLFHRNFHRKSSFAFNCDKQLGNGSGLLPKGDIIIRSFQRLALVQEIRRKIIFTIRTNRHRGSGKLTMRVIFLYFDYVFNDFLTRSNGKCGIYFQKITNTLYNSKQCTYNVHVKNLFSRSPNYTLFRTYILIITINS